jgi:C_GCAxxG_C_C family probable redox protein
MKTDVESAVESFLSGYNCAQSVFRVFASRYGLEEKIALRLATGLGGGIARRGDICGAASGGVLALGLAQGRGLGDDKSVAAACYEKTRLFLAQFEKRNGAVSCRALLGGCDLMTPEGQARYRAEDMQHKTCVHCVKSAVELVSDLLSESSVSLKG